MIDNIIDESNNVLNVVLNLDMVNEKEICNNKIILEFVDSIISNWMLKNLDKKSKLLNTNYKSIIDMQNKLISIEWIKKVISNTNNINNYHLEIEYDDEFYSNLNYLISHGVEFDAKFNLEHIIRINSQELVFPICCVGKNRSQYLFYYLKNLQSIEFQNDENKEVFELAYPSSGDELSILKEHIEFINKNTNMNTNYEYKKILSKPILSSYSTKYKKDSFSSAISRSFGFTNPDNLDDIPRSVHIFDKVLKNKTSYLPEDLKNFESYKYNTNKYNIFDLNSKDYMKIKDLYLKYFFNPSNLFKILLKTNYNKISKLTYICLSDKSFYNLIKCFYTIKLLNSEIDLNNLRIIYFAIPDIFQKSYIKDTELIEYKKKFTSSFQIY